MHGMAGQVDFRKLSGLLKVPGFRLTMWCMFIGCLFLAAAPFTASALSKDVILMQALTSDVEQVRWMGWIGILTAGITAYYAFRVWFRLATGPVMIEPGPEQHGHDDHGHDDHGHGHDANAAHGGHGFHPHAPGLRMSLVLAVIAIGSVLAGLPSYLEKSQGFNWIQRFVEHSSASIRAAEPEHGMILGRDAHSTLFAIATGVCVLGIALAFVLHLQNRALADRLRASFLANPLLRWLPIGSEHGWGFDGLYHRLFAVPAWITAQVLSFLDRFVLDGVAVAAVGRLPAFVGRVFQPLYAGTVQGYALTMAGGTGLIVAWVVWVWLKGGVQ
jgi:NADH-quinone oxidoreductase subunit L